MFRTFVVALALTIVSSCASYKEERDPYPYAKAAVDRVLDPSDFPQAASDDCTVKTNANGRVDRTDSGTFYAVTHTASRDCQAVRWVRDASGNLMKASSRTAVPPASDRREPRSLTPTPSVAPPAEEKGKPVTIDDRSPEERAARGPLNTPIERKVLPEVKAQVKVSELKHQPTRLERLRNKALQEQQTVARTGEGS
jgi:hypothetical protein